MFPQLAVYMINIFFTPNAILYKLESNIISRTCKIQVTQVSFPITEPISNVIVMS